MVLFCALLALAESRANGHIATEFLPERLCVVRIDLGDIASTRDRNVCHAAVEQIPWGILGFDSDVEILSPESLRQDWRSEHTGSGLFIKGRATIRLIKA